MNILQYESDVWRTADLLIGAGIKQSDFPKFMMPYFALILVESRFSGHTFAINDDPVPGYLIDFGKKQMPLKYRERKDLFFENKNDYAYLTREFLENEKYLQFSYHWEKDIFNCIYIKNENKAIKIRNPNNWLERVPALFIKPSFAKDNYFVSVFNNSQCVNLRKISKKQG